MSSAPKDQSTNGHDKDALSGDQQIVEAMEEAYDFPGYYPVVVIVRQGVGFEADLQATVVAEQGEAPFRISERRSRKGTYISYRVELYVETAHAALDRKQTLADMRGVIVCL